MKTRRSITIITALAVGAVGLSGIAVAQGQGGGGKKVPPDYGDLVLLYRDASGVPILDGSDCLQPLAFPANVGCPATGLIDTGDALVIPTDPETCAIEPLFASCAEEADFGRTNLSRANEGVLDSQLEDVVVNLAVADCTSLDPAGRMVYSRYVGDDLVSGTIDSPLQNLSVYKHLIRDGTIGVPLPEGASAMEQAARGFGVAMDKAGEVNVDLLVYLNEILGLTEGTTIFGEPTCIDIKQEVMGNVEYVEKCFLNYASYGYDRSINFWSLPSPAYIPEGAEINGWFEFLMQTGPTSWMVVNDAIMTAVFQNDPGFTSGNIGGFSQAADDTRAVVNFMHSHAVPADAATPVPCAPTPDPTEQYDVSISDKSGLKVPKQVVATTEGREFVVTVANAGPDTAAGTLIVTATRDDGGDVLVNGVPGPFVYTFEDVLPGLTYTTGTQIFTLGPPYDGTTISWQAYAVPHSEDPVMSNNTVYKTSNVRPERGGGH